MPPRTRRAANQENAGPPPASPVLTSKKRKIATEPEPTPRPSRILQDITSQFIEPELVVGGSKQTVSKEEPQPPPRKRRARAPIGRFAKRQQLVGPSHHPAIPSSLPPSSPPSESSRFDVINQAFAGPRFTRNRSPSLEYADENENADPFSESLDLLPAAASSNQADPFGFLAVESRLRAKREAAQPFHVLTDLDLPVDDDHPTPHPDTFEDDNDENAVPLGVPSTPHKRKKHIRSMVAASTSPTSAALYNPSPQSTPSPSKPRRSLAKGNQSPVDSSESDLVLSRPPIASAARRARITAHEENAKARKEARAPKKSLTPRTLGKSLEALLPKRVTRARAASSKGKGKGKRGREAVSDDEEDDPSPRKTKKRAIVAKKPTSKAKGKAKATEVEDEEIDVDGAQEKLKQERQARLEYFKKLDSYKVEEENVYVV
ncbi:hypothetical protein PC9H_008087 [Pleurotus ostreatus]|uniref:Uncharacterized protein n=1 Tax=Pleurotus ostreatus TaxID=5322 RepID=A0A8H7DTD0_PLEOS|nr:uncharacterized protein PC9H_008087 [Pleurotus ostreatus]KAF7428855.1 hypothetical protein PC9H_008087 [Pleurotus ostreatus]KAJ8697091.1 hypothetical protein PTI98_006897 [Pleurotus ostreatus]